ncbi:KRAB-A domain-containing protein 2-like [Oopsacas minuta]|uniref:KRAB-A domain-containing protein 2-like n=1 Tax=Oopsacas minuta TaxID=111878 RepID=A0AAV7JTQ5_9METZ|nr:KRAB-A domain-containing protein 2-like [Oopsacas minuta]
MGQLIEAVLKKTCFYSCGERERNRIIKGCREDNCNTNDRNWGRTKLRYSVEEFEGAKVLYLKEREYRGITRSKLRVVAKEDLWDTLVAAHQALSHGGRDKMHEYFESHNYHVLIDVITLFVRLCAICQANKGRKSTLKVIHRPIIPGNVGLRGQADLVDMQTCSDKEYCYILNYQDCFSKFVVLRALKSTQAEEVAEHLVLIFCEHGPPHILHTDNGREFVNDHLFTALRRLWTRTHLVRGRPRHSQDQGSVERANDDFKKQLFARLKDAGKASNQWVSELPFVQYSKNNAYHSGIKATPFSVHLGRTPPDLSVDMLLPSEVLNTLDDEDQLEQALATRQVTEYAHTPHPPPPPSPMSLTSLSLQEPADEIDIAGSATLTDTALPQPCSSHDISTYPSCTPSQEQEDTPADDTDTDDLLTTLRPTSSVFADDLDDDSYNLTVPPLIGTYVAPYINITSGQSEPIPSDPSFSPLPPSFPIPSAPDIYFTDHPLCPACRRGDGNCTVSCSYCKLDPFHADCLDRVEAYGKTPVQYFCARDEYCRKAQDTAKIRQGCWGALGKQGADMIQSSKKRRKTIEKGDNVRISIPYADRASIGPRSLIGTVMDVYSGGGAFKIGTAQGTISTAFTNKDLTPCGTDKLLNPDDVPDTQVSVSTAARIEAGVTSRVSCQCTKACRNMNCPCKQKQVKCNSRCHSHSTACENR